jgi:hypothetical protein
LVAFGFPFLVIVAFGRCHGKGADAAQGHIGKANLMARLALAILLSAWDILTKTMSDLRGQP